MSSSEYFTATIFVYVTQKLLKQYTKIKYMGVLISP